MVARKFLVRHSNVTFDVDYDTDDGLQVFKFQLFSLTSIPPDEQKILQGDDDRVISDDSDLIALTNELKLVSINEVDKIKEKESSSNADSAARGDASFLISDEELARRLQAEEEAQMFQQFAASEQSAQFENRIRPYVSQVLMYEDTVRQEAARTTVPVEELEEKALVSLAKEGNFKPSKIEQDHAFLLQLLFWFKESFRWVNAPPCDGCGSSTVNQGMGNALPFETQYGASRVELYRCSSCPRMTRFPRYNDPLKILDFTDHVWTECFSQNLGRWNKKLNYVIAIAKDGVYDVTKHYTRKWLEVLSRRNIVIEPVLSATLSNITKDCRRSYAPEVIALLEDRDMKETEEIERGLYSTDDSSVLLPGRQSGDKEWRISRLEIGSNEDSSFSCSSCPVRACIDDHVTKIYDALFPVLCQFIENSLAKSRAVEILKIFKGILEDLKNLPYKTRRTCVNPFVLHLLPFFNKVLDVLSLRSEIGNDEQVYICLAGDPVKTSLTLPVVLDALDDLIFNVEKYDNLTKALLSFPLVRLNRVHSGSVLATGEELPFGIATSAFDGLRATKWEEPNGAKGCWIMYKLPANQKHELVAYDLMSANDAPERDPADWVVEGSDDGGSSWHVLDRQTSQVFEN